MEQFGKFLDDGRVYKILTPNTPAPWYNYLFNKEFVCHVSQCGQGRSLSLDPVNSQIHPGQRYFYLKDNITGNFHSTLYLPQQSKLNSYSCEHSLGYTQIVTEVNDVKICHRVFVPLKGQQEIWTITLNNTAARERDLSLYYYMPIAKWDGQFLIRSEYDDKNGILSIPMRPYFARMSDYEMGQTQKTTLAVFSDIKADSWVGSDNGFLGAGNLPHSPEALKQDSLPGETGVFEPVCAAFQWKMKIKPRGSCQIHLFINAMSLDEFQDGRTVEIFKESTESNYVRKNFEDVQEFWRQAYNNNHIETPDADFNYAVNAWVKKQLYFMSYTHRVSPSPCVRNELQDMQGLALLENQYPQECIKKVVGFQNTDGYLPHSLTLNKFSKLSGIALLNYKDGHVWLPMAVATCAKQHGLKFLDEKVQFKDSDESATIHEHVMRAFRYIKADLGSHGLPLLGDGDWDDPLSAPGAKGKGQSTWIAMATIYAAKEYMTVAVKINPDDAAELSDLIELLNKNINENCWDGKWYIRGYDDDGKPFGCSADREGKIFLNSLSWAILSGTAKDKRAESVFEVIDNVLDTDCGPYTIEPPFTKVDQRIGKITVKMPGSSENGSIYCHAAMFKAMADAIAGRGTKTHQTLMKIYPQNPRNPANKSLQPPLYIPNFYIGPVDKNAFGKSSLYNSTGSAAWFMRIALDYMAGLKVEPDGIRIDPCIPAQWKIVKAHRTIRGIDINLIIENPKGLEKGVALITVDNEIINGSYIEYSSLKQNCCINVIMG